MKKLKTTILCAFLAGIGGMMLVLWGDRDMNSYILMFKIPRELAKNYSEDLKRGQFPQNDNSPFFRELLVPTAKRYHIYFVPDRKNRKFKLLYHRKKTGKWWEIFIYPARITSSSVPESLPNMIPPLEE